MSSRSVDLVFRVHGDLLPTNNGYSTYAAISKALGRHLDESIGVNPIRSGSMTRSSLLVDHTSKLRIRTPLEHLPSLHALTGTTIEIDRSSARLSDPRIEEVEPASLLYSRVVTIQNAFTEPQLRTAVRIRLDEMGLGSAEAYVPRTPDGHARRRTVHIKGVPIVGYSLVVENLTDEQSRVLIDRGLGGRRHMGCGIFFGPKNPLHLRT